MVFKKPIYFDIETGGLKPSGDKASSILSISHGQGLDIQERFSLPTTHSFVSDFSRKSILPQVTSASQTFSEKQNLERFIRELEINPERPVAGYNIDNFDIPFMRQRAARYGLEGRFNVAMSGRGQLDMASRVKEILSQSISEHISAGTFKQELGGAETFGAATVASKAGKLTKTQQQNFNLLRQMKTYGEGGGRHVRGWTLGETFKLLEPDSPLLSQAHQASADIQMTERLHQGLASGRFQERLKDPEVARSWLNATRRLKEESDIVPRAARSAGQFYRPRYIDRAREIFTRIPPNTRKTILGGAMLAGALGAIVAGANAFSGSDDAWNNIEGLSHKGTASEYRKQYTDFGSGYTGLVNVPKELAKRMKMGFGRTANIEDLVKQTKGEIVDLAMGYKKSMPGVNWQRSPLGKEVGDFYRELKIAQEAGFDDIMLINKDLISKKIKNENIRRYREAKKAGVEFTKKDLVSETYLTKHTIRHERLHLSRRLANEQRPSPDIAPDEFLETLVKQKYNRGNTVSYGEEFLANLTASTSQPVDFIRIAEGVSPVSTLKMSNLEQKMKAYEEIARIEMKGREERAIRAKVGYHIQKAEKKLARARLQQGISQNISRAGKNGSKRSRSNISNR